MSQTRVDSLGRESPAFAPVVPVAPPPAHILSAPVTGLEAATISAEEPRAARRMTGRLVEGTLTVSAEAPAAESLPTTAKVVGVYDGDTITLDTGHKVRVMNVNCPEKRPLEPFALEARDFTKKLLMNKKVTLVYRGDRKRDGYGRLLAEIRVGDKDLSEELLRQGFGHLFLLADGVPPAQQARLLGAQEEAKAAKRGIWSLERYQNPLDVSSFHANGRGNDEDDPNVEYFRLVNISALPVDLGTLTVTNRAGKSWKLPRMVLEPGRTVQVLSGVKDEVQYPGPEHIFLGNEEPIWDNAGDTLTVKQGNEVVLQREYVGRSFDPDELPNPVSQAAIRRLGADADVVYRSPRSVRIEDYEVDDGDTLFFPSPRAGTFKVTVEGVERKVVIADQRETPEGHLAVRFVGVDTPETHVRGRGPNGEEQYFDQGKPAQLAKRALRRILSKATRVEVRPNEGRPFDTYDRLLGTVWAVMPDGTRVDVNEWLVENGHGEMYAYYNGEEFDERRFQRLSAAARKAVEGERGIYSDGEHRLEERPSDFRRRVQGKPPARIYVADYETKLVYSSSEVDQVPPYNRIWISPRRLKQACLDLGLTMAPEASSSSEAAGENKAAGG